ncbi:hypothetical protein PA598K_03486 [Paenibacillus sp. 598K]|nr:hypothetical protein PA598K_03486 [Paenibacillus sp. 598K]
MLTPSPVPWTDTLNAPDSSESAGGTAAVGSPSKVVADVDLILDVPATDCRPTRTVCETSCCTG